MGRHYNMSCSYWFNLYNTVSWLFYFLIVIFFTLLSKTHIKVIKGYINLQGLKVFSSKWKLSECFFSFFLVFVELGRFNQFLNDFFFQTKLLSRIVNVLRRFLAKSQYWYLNKTSYAQEQGLRAYHTTLVSFIHGRAERAGVS